MPSLLSLMLSACVPMIPAFFCRSRVMSIRCCLRTVFWSSQVLPRDLNRDCASSWRSRCSCASRSSFSSLVRFGAILLLARTQARSNVARSKPGPGGVPAFALASEHVRAQIQ